MNELRRNLRRVAILFAIISVLLLGGLVVQQGRSQTDLGHIVGENKAALAERYGKDAGAIYTKDGRALAISVDGQRQYPYWPDSNAYVHLVGDYTHNLSNTLELVYEGRLMGTERNFIDQLILDVSGRGRSGNDLRTTLHDGLSMSVLQAMGGYEGAAVVLNWATGEVLCSLSLPAVNYPDLIAYNEENFPPTSLFNRALQGAYMPGSTFKMFTAAAWLDSPNYDPNFQLEVTDGDPVIPGGARDRGLNGLYDLDRAFLDSCNVFFGELGRKIGRDPYLDYLDRMGFNDPLSLDRIKVRKPKATVPPNDEVLLSWFAVGQPVGEVELEFNPLSLASYAGAVANEGIQMEPKIVGAFVDPLGRESERLQPTVKARPWTAQTADQVHDLMAMVAREYGVYVDGLEIGLKTGTGEREDQQGYVSLITSHSYNPDYPYAVCVILDNAWGGYDSVAPIIQQIYQTLAWMKP